jgi:hypothetical protein
MKEPVLPGVNVVPEAVLEETKRLRSSFVCPRIDDEGYTGALPCTEGASVAVGWDDSVRPTLVFDVAIGCRVGDAGMTIGGCGNCANRLDVSRESSFVSCAYRGTFVSGIQFIEQSRKIRNLLRAHHMRQVHGRRIARLLIGM